MDVYSVMGVFIEMCVAALILVHHIVSLVQYLCLLISMLIITPVITLLAYDLTLYLLRVFHLKQLVRAMIQRIHHWRSNTRGLWTMRLKSIGKRQMYNQKAICEASITG